MAIETLTYEQFFGDNQALLAWKNNAATHRGEAAESAARELMAPHEDLLVKGGLDEYARRQHQAAFNAYNEDLEAGKDNFAIIGSIGFAALFTGLEERRSLYSSIESMSEDSRLFKVAAEGDATLFGIKLPFGHISTHSSRDTQLEKFVIHPLIVPMSKPPVAMGVWQFPSKNVVRIETSAGELWQNPKFSPKGVPK